MPITITINKQELYDEKTNTFSSIDKNYDILLEHSLLSISKWEAKWHKPYLTDEKKTDEEIRDYIRCMTISPNVPDYLYNYIPNNELNKIVEYINDPSTATTIKEHNVINRPNREILTNELIYYYMFKLEIPKECEKWHINRLITLLRIFGIKDSDPKANKLSRSELIARNKAINARNRAKYKTKG